MLSTASHQALFGHPIALVIHTHWSPGPGPQIIPPKAFHQIFEMVAILSGQVFTDLSRLELSFCTFFEICLDYGNSPSQPKNLSGWTGKAFLGLKFHLDS